MALSAGTRLGPYEIQSPLGAGGMGEVYKARDTRLDRTVAIKILPEALAADPQFRERFDREARAISQLTHPHICVLYDVGHQEGVDLNGARAVSWTRGQSSVLRLLQIVRQSEGDGISEPVLKLMPSCRGALKQTTYGK